MSGFSDSIDKNRAVILTWTSEPVWNRKKKQKMILKKNRRKNLKRNQKKTRLKKKRKRETFGRPDFELENTASGKVHCKLRQLHCKDRSYQRGLRRGDNAQPR